MLKLWLVGAVGLVLVGCGTTAQEGVTTPSSVVLMEEEDTGVGVTALGKETGKTIKLFALVEYRVPQKDFRSFRVEGHYLSKLLKDNGYVLVDVTVRKQKGSF